jgi:hypothetical protein
MSVHPAVEVERLVSLGVLNNDMSYNFAPESPVFLSFSNIVQGRSLTAGISRDPMHADGFEMIVSEEVAGHEPEVVSVYRHESLEHLVRTATGFLCYYNRKRLARKKVDKVTITLRVDKDLRNAFDSAAEATGESQAVVLRQLIRFFIGKGPDPRVSG